MKKLFLINCRQPLIDAFVSLGCEVCCIRSYDNELDVSSKLNELGFKPDLIFQQEILGLRLFLSGMHKIDCIKIFWSVDTHLNMHWHGVYGSLFDGVLTTQKKYVPILKKNCEAEICWIPWMGARLGIQSGTTGGLIPYSSRSHSLTFVGRVTKARPSRLWFIKFLNSHFDLHQVEDLNYSQMMEVYRQTRIVPNEAIFGEINFRIFEACSCGCAVVTPDIGEELGELFDIGKEIIVYRDVLELKEILSRLQADPSYAASLGLAGYERIMRDHLPVNRAKSILDFVKRISKRKVDIDDAQLYANLACASLGESGGMTVEWGNLINKLLACKMGVMRDAALFRLSVRADLRELYLLIAKPYFEKKIFPKNCYFNMIASLCAVHLGLNDLALKWWFSYVSAVYDQKKNKPKDTLELLMFWGDELFKNGITLRPGVAFNEASDIPSCAADCYFAALYIDPKNLAVFKRLDLIFADVMGGEPTRLGFLSQLSLHHPRDWHICADIGITNLKVFRLTEGLNDLDFARNLAIEAGRERFFKRKVLSDLPSYFRLVYND
ncbi:glycosyltransferase [Maridesulfovibrio zosterae]|uniref:glycosyltransferase family protein n=1 Tax=Maridesulfovibrio zosterae TaxID=82171 RepID=UPI0004086D64|nr:glycosyltransferase [Maridesulfovibrio zosterae]